MVKEVSDRVIVLLLILAIVVSVFGTYLVYNKASDVGVGGVVVQNIERIIREEPPSEGIVGVVVINPAEER